GHHEHVRTQSLAAKRGPLEHAEAMLLVDDDETELVKAHIALHKRMGTHDEMDAASFDFGKLLLPGGGGRRAGEQSDSKARRLQQTRDVEKMLLGENLGRRHERDL